jgi:predicted alpha/beta hydrolase
MNLVDIHGYQFCSHSFGGVVHCLFGRQDRLGHLPVQVYCCNNSSHSWTPATKYSSCSGGQ